MKFRICTVLLLLAAVFDTNASEQDEIVTVVEHYIESQHVGSSSRMESALHHKLAKRTYWEDREGKEFIMESSFKSMQGVAEHYNSKGDKFPKHPRVDIEIFDIDDRVASVKLSTDDWIDYMHLLKTDQDEWKIINVLWQYHETGKHRVKK